MASTKLCKLKCNNKQYYLSTTDEAGHLQLLLTDTCKAWRGNVSWEELRAGNKDMNLDENEANSRRALAGEDINGFEYDLKEEGDSVRLIWKKVVEHDHIKFQLGSVVMHPVTELGVAISSMFDHLIQSATDLRLHVAELETKHERLASERCEALQKLSESVGIKEKTEEDLFAKFVVVLNDKKAKIRHLKAELEAAQTGTASRTGAQSTSDAQKLKDRDEQQKTSRDRRTSAGNVSCSTDDDDEKHDEAKQECCTTVTSSKAAEDERRSRKDAADSSVELMLEDSCGDGDEEMPVVAKRSGARKRPTTDRERSPEWQPVPLMLSMTGTTNTSTTSSDGQRWREKTGTKKEKEKETTSTSPNRNSISRTAEVDDLIGDMA